MTTRFTTYVPSPSHRSWYPCLLALASLTACSMEAASLGDGPGQGGSAGTGTEPAHEDSSVVATGGDSGNGTGAAVEAGTAGLGSEPVTSNTGENPTGDCTADDFSVINPEGWLPDCQNELKREYYSVYASGAESAFTLPRVDGALGLELPCATTTHALSSIVRRYALCEVADTDAKVEIVNDMQPADALAVTHYLNSILVFRVSRESAVGVWPFPYEDDTAAACTLDPETRSAELVAFCDDVARLNETGWAMAPAAPEGQAVAELAGRLNSIYGIGPNCRDELPLEVGTACDPAGGYAEPRVVCSLPCSDDVDCEEASGGAYCQDNTCMPIPRCD